MKLKNDDDDDDKWRWQWRILSLITIDDDDDDTKRHWNSDDVQMMIWELSLITPPLGVDCSTTLDPKTTIIFHVAPNKVIKNWLTLYIQSEFIWNGRSLCIGSFACVLSRCVPYHSLDNQTLIGNNDPSINVVMKLLALEEKYRKKLILINF